MFLIQHFSRSEHLSKCNSTTVLLQDTTDPYCKKDARFGDFQLHVHVVCIHMIHLYQYTSVLLIQFVIYFHANKLFQQQVKLLIGYIFSCKSVIPAASCLSSLSCNPVISEASCLFSLSFIFIKTSYFISHFFIHFVIYFHASLVFQQPVSYSVCHLFSCKPVIAAASFLFILS